MAGLEHLWFISFIIVCYLITPILQSIYKNLLKDKTEIKFWITFILVIIFIQFIYLIGIININVPNLLCYIIGYFISRRYFNPSCKKINDKIKISYITIIFTLLAIITNGLVIYLRYVKKVKGMELGNLFFDYSHMLLGLSIFFIIYYIFKNIKLKQSKILDFSDKYSFEIYILHQFYILGRFSMMGLTSILPVNIIIITFTIIISAFILKYLANVAFNLLNKKEIKVISD